LAEKKGFKNFDSIQKRIMAMPGKLTRQIEDAVKAEMRIELAEVKRRTPLDTGALRASEYVDGPFVERGRIYASIVAGGPTAPYAMIVHENLEAFHRIGQAKYLESVLRESAQFMAARIARRLSVKKLG
jgi:hypothetical protein